MKFTIATRLLVDALKKLQPVTGTKTTLPELKCVLVRVTADQISLTTSNLDQELTILVPCESVNGTGTLAVPLALWLRILNGCESEVTIEANEKEQITIKAGTASSKVHCLPAAGFPESMKVEGEAVELPAELSTWIHRVLPAVSVDETRYHLCGVFIAGRDGRLFMVATDARILSLVETDQAFTSPGVILPTMSARLLADLAGPAGATLQIGSNAVQASGSNWQLRSKVVEADYPNFRQVIPDLTNEFKVDRTKLLAALDYVSATTSEKAQSVKFTFTAGELELSSSTPEVGESRKCLPLEGDARSRDVITAFNPEYFKRIVKANPEGIIRMQIDNAQSPAKIIAAGFMGVVMPIRVA